MQYVIPEKCIHPKASEVNGLTVIDGQLYHHGEVVEAFDARSALSNFCQFITSCAAKVVLLAHNGLRFDFSR
jgi:hypothetical protein